MSESANYYGSHDSGQSGSQTNEQREIMDLVKINRRGGTNSVNGQKCHGNYASRATGRNTSNVSGDQINQYSKLRNPKEMNRPDGYVNRSIPNGNVYGRVKPSEMKGSKESNVNHAVGPGFRSRVFENNHLNKDRGKNSQKGDHTALKSLVNGSESCSGGSNQNLDTNQRKFEKSTLKEFVEHKSFWPREHRGKGNPTWSNRSGDKGRGFYRSQELSGSKVKETKYSYDEAKINSYIKENEATVPKVSHHKGSSQINGPQRSDNGNSVEESKILVQEVGNPGEVNLPKVTKDTETQLKLMKVNSKGSCSESNNQETSSAKRTYKMNETYESSVTRGNQPVFNDPAIIATGTVEIKRNLKRDEMIDSSVNAVLNHPRAVVNRETTSNCTDSIVQNSKGDNPKPCDDQAGVNRPKDISSRVTVYINEPEVQETRKPSEVNVPKENNATNTSEMISQVVGAEENPLGIDWPKLTIDQEDAVINESIVTDVRNHQNLSSKPKINLDRGNPSVTKTSNDTRGTSCTIATNSIDCKQEVSVAPTQIKPDHTGASPAKELIKSVQSDKGKSSPKDDKDRIIKIVENKFVLTCKNKCPTVNNSRSNENQKSKRPISVQPNEKQHKVSGESPSNNNYKKKKKAKNDLEISPFLIGLQLDEPFDAQAVHMISQFEMTLRERVKVDQLKDDLTKVFSPLIRNVKLVLFGSVIAGTAFKNSDVDIYLGCYDSLPQGNARDFIIRHGYTILKGGLFRHGVRIANARVPIMKAVHISSGISVDVSFHTDCNETHFGLSNSILVKHLCSHDPRVRKLIMLVLFWAKYHSFVEKYKISSFTFILMVVFYLQIVEILPPLYKIIEVQEGEPGWSTSFNSDPSFLVNNNTESLESLFLGFFTFYSAVRYDEVVISPFAGELVLGILFETLDLLPQCYSRYTQLVGSKKVVPFTRSDMSIQEPFNMSWNTVRSVSVKVTEMLKRGCHNVCDVFAKFASERALSIILSEYHSVEGEEDSYAWQLPCHSDLTPEEWHKKVVNATHTVFSSILLMEVHRGAHKLDDSVFSKFYFSSDVDNPIRFIVSSEYLVACKERNKLIKAYNSTRFSELEKQIKVSSLYAEVLKKKEKKYNFEAAVYIIKNEKNGSVEITINNFFKLQKSRKVEHRNFLAYLKNENFKHFLTLALELELVDNSSNLDPCIKK